MVKEFSACWDYENGILKVRFSVAEPSTSTDASKEAFKEGRGTAAGLPHQISLQFEHTHILNV